MTGSVCNATAGTTALSTFPETEPGDVDVDFWLDGIAFAPAVVSHGGKLDGSGGGGNLSGGADSLALVLFSVGWYFGQTRNQGGYPLGLSSPHNPPAIPKIKASEMP